MESFSFPTGGPLTDQICPKCGGREHFRGPDNRIYDCECKELADTERYLSRLLLGKDRITHALKSRKLTSLLAPKNWGPWLIQVPSVFTWRRYLRGAAGWNYHANTARGHKEPCNIVMLDASSLVSIWWDAEKKKKLLRADVLIVVCEPYPSHSPTNPDHFSRSMQDIMIERTGNQRATWVVSRHFEKEDAKEFTDLQKFKEEAISLCEAQTLKLGPDFVKPKAATQNPKTAVSSPAAPTKRHGQQFQSVQSQRQGPNIAGLNTALLRCNEEVQNRIPILKEELHASHASSGSDSQPQGG